MSNASARPRPPRPTGAARRRAEAQRHKRNRLLFGGSVTAVVALVALVIALHVANSSSVAASSSGSSGVSLAVGTTAPDGAFTTLAGKTETVAGLRGKPALIWFVTTWCSSCQAGTQSMAQNVATLASDGVRVVEVENNADLGQSGPPIATFAQTLAGSAFSNPDWVFGEASASLTHTYNPRAYLDIYYLINAEGKITYVNSSPGSTMPQLLSAAKALA
ncbi:MAG TPA: redoxin domain-containing protein [Candidatus Dormibacteraeota bacterium]|nr:redoxin domain-containing protein [Candidatus Dormibacteraeota bacterium]